MAASGPAEKLGDFEMFADCEPADLKRLSRDGVETSVPAGWTLIHDETPGDACYVILEGSAEVKVDGSTVASLGPGDVVGEVALLSAGLRTANVVATSDLSLLRIDADAFAKLVEERPQLRKALTRRTGG